MIRTYGKAILASLYACMLVSIPLCTGDHHIDPGEGVTIAIAVVTNAGVWLIPLAPGAKWTKTAAGVLLAGLGVAAMVILDHAIDANDTMMIPAAVLGRGRPRGDPMFQLVHDCTVRAASATRDGLWTTSGVPFHLAVSCSG